MGKEQVMQAQKEETIIPLNAKAISPVYDTDECLAHERDLRLRQGFNENGKRVFLVDMPDFSGGNTVNGQLVRPTVVVQLTTVNFVPAAVYTPVDDNKVTKPIYLLMPHLDPRIVENGSMDSPYKLEEHP